MNLLDEFGWIGLFGLILINWITTTTTTTTTEVGMDNTRLQILQTFIWQAFDAI